MPVADVDARIERLSVASTRRILEPETDVLGEIGPGAVLPPQLLSVEGLDLDLSPQQLADLSREELASIVEFGLRFEAVLMTGFAMQMVSASDLTDPRVVYALHEIGEETRHSRLFSRLLGQLQGKAHNPWDRRSLRRVERLAVGQLIRRPALLDVLVLAGEEIPDLFQKRASEHPDTDPFIVAVSRYHRQEEARHLAFARSVLPEHWARASWDDRFAVRHIAPRVVRGMFDMMVHPGVYETVGLPGWRTWKAVNGSPKRLALRREATRPILAAMLEAEVVKPGRIPRGWRQLCGVDQTGVSLGE
jgi:hypothetical protein